MAMWSKYIIVLGAGDRGTAVSIRFFNSGFRPLLVERENPTDLHYFRNFSDSVYQGEKIVDNTTCIYLGSRFTHSEIENIRMDRKIPCISIPDIELLTDLKPDVVVDCTGSFPEPIHLNIGEYKCLIRVGRHYKMGKDGHFIIGDDGPYLGRILPVNYSRTERDESQQDTINAPFEGLFVSDLDPGGRVAERQSIGQLNDINILAPDHGVLAGRLHSGHYVSAHQPLFSIIHPRSADELDIKLIPYEKYSIAGGALEATLAHLYSKHNKKEREKIS